METVFTPVNSLIGGGLIGLSAVMLMLTLGRIMGVTGLVAGIVSPNSRPEWAWRVAVLVGMLAAPVVVMLATGTMSVVQVSAGTPVLIIGGLLVGLGTTLGSGCTSGHGVCGLARLSPRSLVATLTFMASAATTVFVIRHLLEA